MKRLFVFILMLAVSLPVLAREDKKHNFELAYEYSDYGYREPHMEYPIHNTATKQGFSVMYMRQSLKSADVDADDPTFGSLEFRYMNGDADYDGYLQDGTPFKTTGDKDYYMEAALKLGQYYRLGSDVVRVWPYMGIGWRSLRNGEDGLKDYGGVVGYSYQRTSTYIYVPLGLNLTFEMGSSSRFTVNGQFDWLIPGNQNSHVDDTWNVGSVSNKQDKGFGLRVSGKLETDLGGIGIFVEPFYRYWKIQNSDKVTYYEYDPGTSAWYEGQMWEPFNITREYGIRAGITF